MKKRTKGILAFAFLGGIMVTSTVVIAIPGLDPVDHDMGHMGRPMAADPNQDYSLNYAVDERTMHCGTGSPPGSTDYIREFEIPTACTNPLAIAVDYDGNPWFAQSNTGRVATFDVGTETFTEYHNPAWPEGFRSMMWGLDYAPDGHVWFTDDSGNSLWVFNHELEQYGQLPLPMISESQFPQRLSVEGSELIVNDFYGNMLIFLNPSNPESFMIAPSPISGSVTADFVVDPDGNIWYTTWAYPDGDGYLVQFDYDRYVAAVANAGQAFLPPIDFVDLYPLPEVILTPNGIALSDDGSVWLADTTSSSFYEFNPLFPFFVQYVTADPLPSAYGNKTGVVPTPISRPYWMSTDDMGRIIFNAQTSNNISVMDPMTQTLVEYHVPSKNPYWSDCNADPDSAAATDDSCGIAQVFGFDAYRDKIWFTEWAENKIGVVDTSVPLPFDVVVSDEVVQMSPGDTSAVAFEAARPSGMAGGGAATGGLDAGEASVPYAVSASEHFSVTLLNDGGQGMTDDLQGNAAAGGALEYGVLISASEDTPPGLYKVLLGVQSPDVAVGKFVTVTVL